MKTSFLMIPGACLALASLAPAQQVVVTPSGDKIEVPPQFDRNGKQIDLNPIAILPSAPLVGGADSCVTPDVIAGSGPHSYDSTAATTGTEGQTEVMCTFFATTVIGKDVWFTWNATFTGMARVDLCGTTTQDTRVAVYAGNTCPTAGTALACDDDACVTNALNSKTNFYCTLGQDYVIQLGGFSTTTGGTGTFSINSTTAAAGDDCATPVTVVGGGPHAFDLENATTSTQGQTEALCGAGGAARIPRDQWFVWNATFTGSAQARTCGGTTVNTKMAVYAGNTCPGAAAIGCNDTLCGTQAGVTFACTLGTDYIIQLGMTNNGADPGTGTFTIVNASPSAEDDCSTPLTVVGNGPHAFDTSFATTGTQGQTETLCGAGAAAAIKLDHWYVWNATFTGTAGASTQGQTTLNTKIAVYNGNTCPTAGTAIACNDTFNGVTQALAVFACTLGQDYLIQLGLTNTGTAGGTGTFTLVNATPNAEDNCATPLTVIGGGPHPFNNTFATTGTQGQTETLCGAGTAAAIKLDQWYVWNATFSGTAGVSTQGTLNTKVAVYNGNTCPTAGTALACNDTFQGSTLGLATFTCVLGQDYLIQVGLTSTGTAGGTGTFTIFNAAPPAHDDCATPLALVGGPGTFPVDTRFATTGTQGQAEGICLFSGTSNIRKDVWFTWTSNSSGTATLTTCNLIVGGPTQDSKCAIYAGNGCPAAAAVACNDDATCTASGLNTTVTWPTTCGQTYTIQLGCFSTTNGIIGSFSIAETGTTCNPGVAYCFGDDTGTQCPCSTNPPVSGTVPPGAPGNGCPNSLFPGGANLVAAGTANTAGDTVVLTGSSMPNSTCLYFQGNAQSGGGAGAVFGDGLRCTQTGVVRLGTKTNVANTSQYPGGGDLSVSVKGLVASGNTKHYQCWYRNSALFCVATATFNLTNGVTISWL